MTVYVIFRSVDKDIAFVLDNIVEMYPELDNSLKLQMNFFHFTYRLNDEFLNKSVWKCSRDEGDEEHLLYAWLRLILNFDCNQHEKIHLFIFW